jgi:UDP-N-acetylglucosamine transferase subunit ALG13
MLLEGMPRWRRRKTGFKKGVRMQEQVKQAELLIMHVGLGIMTLLVFIKIVAEHAIGVKTVLSKLLRKDRS